MPAFAARAERQGPRQEALPSRSAPERYHARPAGVSTAGLRKQRDRKENTMLVTKGTSRLNAAQLAEKARFIEERVQDNPRFATPTPTLAAVTAAREALEAATIAAKDGGRTLIAIRRARQAELKLLLDQLAGYVASVAAGDAEAILSSGFAVKRSPSPVGELPAPVDLRAEITAFQGRIDLRWERVPGAAGYQVYQCDTEPTDKTTWRQVGITTKARFSVSGLVSAHTYWFRVAAIGAAGVGPLSEVAHSLCR